jgi:hypothetical protein
VLAARLLGSRPVTFDQFRSQIGLEAGAADTAFRFAHHLYHDVQGGRMLGAWHRQIQDRLWELIREAEDLWWNPEIALKGWDAFVRHGDGSVSTVQETLLPSDSAPDVSVDARHKAGAHDADVVAPVEEIARAQPVVETTNAVGEDRRAMTNAFIEACLRETGVRVTRTMIWRSLGYKYRSEFERWESNHPRATKKSAENFARVLSMPPRDFIGLLKKRSLFR